jgi:Fe-S cluster biogenesis protein NfuA
MQQQPAMRTHTPEEEAETEWTRRQRLVENIANKQQQCRLIEDQGRQCSRTRPLTPECTDLLKMQIACYGCPSSPRTHSSTLQARRSVISSSSFASSSSAT